MGIVSSRPTPDLPPPPVTANPKAAQQRPPAPSEESVNAFARGTEPGMPPFGATPDGFTDELRDLEAKLSRCMQTLTMFYQPIVHAATRARFGYEALLR